MKIKYITFFVFAILFIAIICTTKENVKYNGIIVYTNSTSNLYQLDLSTLILKKIYYDPDFLNYLTKISTNKIIFSADRLMQPTLLKQLDLDNNNIEILGKGTSPTYITEYDILFFYVTEKIIDKPFNGKETLSLYVSNLSNVENARLITQLPEIFFTDSNNVITSSFKKEIWERPVVQISSDKIVFRGIDGSINEYDYVKGKINHSNFVDLCPLGWRDKTNELICCDINAKRFFLIEWREKKTKEISLMINKTHAWRYVKEHDILLFADGDRIWGNIYSYDFESSEVKKIISEPIISDVVYLSTNVK